MRLRMPQRQLPSVSSRRMQKRLLLQCWISFLG
jgi:hypothetical protein